MFKSRPLYLHPLWVWCGGEHTDTLDRRREEPAAPEQREPGVQLERERQTRGRAASGRSGGRGVLWQGQPWRRRAAEEKRGPKHGRGRVRKRSRTLSLQGLSATEPRTLWTSLIRRVAGSRSRLGDMHSAASRPWSWAAGFWGLVFKNLCKEDDDLTLWGGLMFNWCDSSAYDKH